MTAEPHLRQGERELTPPQIEVWVCPICGYWRREQSTGVHMSYPTAGPAVRHTLVKASYIFEGEAE